ncbi:MAG TPA: hypothetical protein VG410_09280 [Solirubrobacteraceae bacterium]|nr:hypothetical protein [Solirubrobacteraceae bacterium]
MTVQPLLHRNETPLRRRRSPRNLHVVRHQLDGSGRDAGPSQDSALYNCGCGFVFEAAVTTSVDCPHCGNHQAW